MQNSSANLQVSRFDIVFEMLEQAKKEERLDIDLHLEQISETNKTIALFQEYQESTLPLSYSFFTRS